MVQMRARIRLLSTEEGGRRAPILSEYRTVFSYGGILKSVIVHLVGRERAFPGDEVEVEMTFLSDYALPPLEIGSRFEVTEATFTSAKGVVLAIGPE